jgi:hypothetical protein
MSGLSPRTPVEPMAFTRTEFLRGARSAWLWATFLHILAWTLIFFPVGMVSAYYVVPSAVAALVVGVAPAWWLGRLLRRTRPIAAHVVAFAAFGAAIGVATTLAFVAIGGMGNLFGDGFPFWMTAVNAVASAAAVVRGWWSTALRALRADGTAPARRSRREQLAGEEDVSGRRPRGR